MLARRIEGGMQGQNGFTITGCLEGVRGVLLAKVVMVVDLTVDNQNRSINPVHRLATGLKVKDCKASMSEAHVLIHPGVVCIWATVLLKAIHALKNGFVGLPEHAAYTAHDLRSSIPLLKRCSLQQ